MEDEEAIKYTYRTVVERKGNYVQRFREIILNERVSGVKCHDCMRYVAFGNYDKEMLRRHTCVEFHGRCQLIQHVANVDWV